MDDYLPQVFCPVCCTLQDSPGWGAQGFECPTCHTKFEVNLEPAKVAEHALYG
jgi:tRNA(Ile2) C34 agmatinyltransferase TiaS